MPAKGRIQDAERDARTSPADVLLATYIGACDRQSALDALDRGAGQAMPGLLALAACAAGDLARAQATLEAEAQATTAAGAFSNPAAAGAYLRALNEVRRALELQVTKARPCRRQLQLSEDEARILSVC